MMTGAFSGVIKRQELQEFGPLGPDFQNNSAFPYELGEEARFSHTHCAVEL